MTLNINTDATVVFTNKLEKLSKSALPLVIKNTLNKAAFDVKQNTMLRESDRVFKKRSPNFFKANSRVDMASGSNINNMKAMVGFISTGLQGGANNYAVRDLEQQEYGGSIKGKSFIPTDKARGGTNARPVRPGNRLSKINKIVDVKNAKGKNSHEKFTKSAIHAGKGGYVLSKNILWRIDSITTKKVKVIGRYRTTKINSTPIYSFDKGRDVKVSATGFMRTAANKTIQHVDDFYISEAKRYIEKYLSK